LFLIKGGFVSNISKISSMDQSSVSAFSPLKEPALDLIKGEVSYVKTLHKGIIDFNPEDPVEGYCTSFFTGKMFYDVPYLTYRMIKDESKKLEDLNSKAPKSIDSSKMSSKEISELKKTTQRKLAAAIISASALLTAAPIALPTLLTIGFVAAAVSAIASAIIVVLGLAALCLFLALGFVMMVEIGENPFHPSFLR
jgi:hypothetical protein